VNRLAVLGHPVSHSRSPAMQTAALVELGLADEWSYEAIDVEPGDFAERVRALPGEGFVGVNVTIPHKEAALAVADDPSEAALQIGAANTLTFADGHIAAENTDASGLVDVLPLTRMPETALVLGAGGSARAAIWALGKQGASVWVWNRTAERAEQLISDFGATSFDPSTKFDLIVNCTAIGMNDEDPFEHLPLDPDDFGDSLVVVDLVYAGTESRLVAAARDRGAMGINGLEVLVAQGAESLRIWTGADPPLDVMREAARRSNP
jgi:shikimate dehydrogenase